MFLHVLNILSHPSNEKIYNNFCITISIQSVFCIEFKTYDDCMVNRMILAYIIKINYCIILFKGLPANKCLF